MKRLTAGCRALAARVSLLAVFGFAATLSNAATSVDTMTVRLREPIAADGALSIAQRDALVNALGAAFVQLGTTRDGAVRLQLTRALSVDDARVAANRVQVLYANVAAMTIAPADSVGNAKDDPQSPPVRRIVVKYRDENVTAAARRNEHLPQALVDRAALRSGIALAHERPMSGGSYVLRLFQAIPAAQARALTRLLDNDPDIEYAEPDLLKEPAFTPNDVYYSQQWHYQSPPSQPGGVNLPPAWDITRGSASIVIGVIDTGILPHPDLAGRYLAGYDMISDALVANDGDPRNCTTPGACSSRDGDATDAGDWVTAGENASGYFQGCRSGDSSFHGTHVAGTIGALSNNGQGVAGVNWVSSLLPVRVLGKCGGYTSDIADAIVWGSGGAVPGVPANANPAVAHAKRACRTRSMPHCHVERSSSSQRATTTATQAVFRPRAAMASSQLLPSASKGNARPTATGAPPSTLRRRAARMALRCCRRTTRAPQRTVHPAGITRYSKARAWRRRMFPESHRSCCRSIRH